MLPCRVVDLGCGSGSNAISLAQHGFRVTGVDFAGPAIAVARLRAAAAGVAIEFVIDDLTNLRRVVGPFDFVVDYGTFDDLDPRARERYVANVVPLAGLNSAFLLWCFDVHVASTWRVGHSARCSSGARRPSSSAGVCFPAGWASCRQCSPCLTSRPRASRPASLRSSQASSSCSGSWQLASCC